jgi:hypothetical protein
MMESIIDIYQMTGQQKSRSYQLTDSKVRAWIIPASNEAVAMYDNAPQGQLFQFRIVSEDISNLVEQSKFVVVYSQISDLIEGDIFITIAGTKRIGIQGKNYLIGTCYKK